MHLTVNINDFYKNNGVTTFVDKMCGFLGIPTNRLKVINIRAGSVYMDYYIVSDTTSDTADVASETSKL